MLSLPAGVKPQQPRRGQSLASVLHAECFLVRHLAISWAGIWSHWTLKVGLALGRRRGSDDK